MLEIENDLLFSSLIKINYDMRFIRIAQDFVENLSGLAGANKNESFKISLLIEECLAFIIDKYIDCRVAAHIQIFFKVTADKKVHIEITDIGPPIHESMIPSFDITNEDSEEGLWYKVVRGLSDKFVFVNQLGSGWLIQIEKNIENVTFSAGGDDGKEKDSLVGREDASGEKHIRPATGDDIPALIDLAYMTYRYSYVFPDFYDEELLKKYIDEKLYDVMLVEHDSKVIGAYAIKYLDADHLSAEVGSGMILPEYRGTDAISLILREVDKCVRTNPQHCEFFISSTVTTHIRSQKAISRMGNGFKPLMIFLNMVPKPEFIGIEHQAGGRESGLYVYHLNDKPKMKKLYITAANHLPIINELIAYTGNDIAVLTEFSEPENLESQISVQRVAAAQFTTISVESIGRDWFTQLSKRIFSAIASGMESVKVTIPTSDPLPSDMERMLLDLNLVFCGLSLRSLESIDLAYCLTTKPVDFSLIKLYEPVAQKLLMHIEQNYGRDQLKEQA
jgi:anti-sigma regulatory factor (Ser/Thr protein kinase)